MSDRAAAGARSTVLSAVLLFLLFMTLFGYWFATLSVSPFEPALTTSQLASAVFLLAFWLLLVLLVFGLLLRGVTLSFLRILKSSIWAKILFPAYLAVHLIIYGIVLEKITVLAEGSPPINFGAQAYLEVSYYFEPHTIVNALLQLTQNPGIIIILPPFYGITLGPFALFSALTIGILVTVHISRLLRLSDRLRMAGGSIVYPAVGIAGGASCCISLPDIAVSVSPFSAAIFSTPLWVNLLYVLYYILPLSVMIAFAVTLLPSGTGRRRN